jgi:signal transduction histidine kinase
MIRLKILLKILMRSVADICFHLKIMSGYIYLSSSLINSVRQYNSKLIHWATIGTLIILNMMLIVSIYKCLIFSLYIFLAMVIFLLFVGFFSLVVVVVRKSNNIIFNYIAVYVPVVLMLASEAYCVRTGQYVEQRFLFSGIVLILVVFASGIIINPLHVLFSGMFSIFRLLFIVFVYKSAFIVDIFVYYLILQIGAIICFYISLRSLYILLYQIHVNSKLIDEKNKDLNRLINLKQDMINMILHDIRNPLNNILFAFQKEQMPSLVYKSVQHILRLADNFIDVHRMEDGAFIIHVNYRPINHTIREAIEQVSYLLPEKNNWIKLHQIASFKLNVDHLLIGRVLVNILTNSIKHSFPNSPIVCNCEFLLDHIRFEVINDGKPVHPDEVQYVFGKYVSNDQTIKTNYNSKGLGLYFCKMAIEAHGGSIGLDTNYPKKGTCMWFTLPHISKLASVAVVKEDTLTQVQLKLSAEEKKIIQPFSVRIGQSEIYETSSIMGILEKLQAPDYPNVQLWKDEVLNAVLIGNRVYYDRLRAMCT